MILSIYPFLPKIKAVLQRPTSGKRVEKTERGKGVEGQDGFSRICSRCQGIQFFMFCLKIIANDATNVGFECLLACYCLSSPREARNTNLICWNREVSVCLALLRPLVLAQYLVISFMCWRVSSRIAMAFSKRGDKIRND